MKTMSDTSSYNGKIYRESSWITNLFYESELSAQEKAIVIKKTVEQYKSDYVKLATLNKSFSENKSLPRALQEWE